jgi:hypothetical protein
VNGPGEKTVIPPTALSDHDRRGASANPYDPPTSMNVAPNESVARQSPRADCWKQELLAAPNPMEPKIAADEPTSRPNVTPRYGCAFEKGWLPPIAVITPTLASAKVPRRGGCSTPLEGDVPRGAATSLGAASGSPAEAAKLASSAAMISRLIARCS